MNRTVVNRPVVDRTVLGRPARRKPWLAIAALLAAACAPLMAQQPYSSSPNGPYGAGAGQYAAPNQYAAPGQGYGYGQPQYSQPQQYEQFDQPQYSAAEPYAGQTTGPQQYGQEQYGLDPYGQGQYTQPEQPQQPQQPLTADQLEQLVAPIALYPDQLLAQILTASTYPAQVAVASQWLKQIEAEGAVSPDQIAAGADSQANWDPSVKALTAFPQVLDTMDQNLEWTTNLGNAYFNQPQDVMQTVQVLRQRAEDAGNLRSTPQEQMSYDQGAIELAPANPQMVYVPSYNPWSVYGAQIAPYPGFSFFGALGSFFGGAPIHYGLGIGLAAFDRMPWGMLAWGLDWLGHEIFFHRDTYFTHSTTVADWGYPRGGPRAYGGWARDSRFQNSAARFDSRSAQAVRSGSAYARTPTPAFARPAQPYGRPEQSLARPAQPLERPAQQFARPAAPAQQAYNRAPEQFSRPQSYAGAEQAYGRSNYGYANGAAQSYAARPDAAYGNPYQSSRAPQATAPRTFAQAPSRGYNGFSSAPQRSGGFQNSGGARAPRTFGGGGEHFKAPKAPKENRSGGGGGKHRR